MNKRDPKIIALLFNECINNQELDGLTNLMSDDYTFIDSKNKIHPSKEDGIKGWGEFFSTYPDYRNNFSKIILKEDLVIIIGYSTCSYEPLDGPALWTARVRNDLIAEWRIYDDTQENREKLGIE